MIPIPDDFTGFVVYYQDGFLLVVEVTNGVHTVRTQTWIGNQDKMMCLTNKDGFDILVTWRDK